MKLTVDDLRKDLESVCAQITADERDIGLVAYIGGVPEEIGDIFAAKFDCEAINLPSTKVDTNCLPPKRIRSFVNSYLPSFLLWGLSYIYRWVSRTNERIPPDDFDITNLMTGRQDSAVLLVDDNVFTGRTMEYWKSQIERNTGRTAYTFSITTLDGYCPDYHCIDGWRSFEWRPIGV
jgi:hypothetical protein